MHKNTHLRHYKQCLKYSSKFATKFPNTNNPKNSHKIRNIKHVKCQMVRSGQPTGVLIHVV
jgi:hypothetical protein